MFFLLEFYCSIKSSYLGNTGLGYLLSLAGTVRSKKSAQIPKLMSEGKLLAGVFHEGSKIQGVSEDNSLGRKPTKFKGR